MIYAILTGNIPLIISETVLLLSAILGVVRGIIESYRNKKAVKIDESKSQNE